MLRTCTELVQVKGWLMADLCYPLEYDHIHRIAQGGDARRPDTYRHSGLPQQCPTHPNRAHIARGEVDVDADELLVHVAVGLRVVLEVPPPEVEQCLHDRSVCEPGG